MSGAPWWSALAIGPNANNTGYVAAASELHPGRLRVVADLDCPWSTTYLLPAARNG